MKTKDKITLGFTGVLVLCALVITGLVLRREFFSPEPQPQVRQIDNWQELELNGQRTGLAAAPVQIIEFFDYQCPFCKQAKPAVEAVKDKYPQRVSVVYEHNPLGGHEYAYSAAVAAECAGRQGKFYPYHDLLFASQDSLGILSYSRLAAAANIPDTTTFGQCVENEETSGIVKSGSALAKKLDINGIPTFIINGKLISGALSKKSLEGMVQEALSEATQ